MKRINATITILIAAMTVAFDVCAQKRLAGFVFVGTIDSTPPLITRVPQGVGVSVTVVRIMHVPAGVVLNAGDQVTMAILHPPANAVGTSFMFTASAFAYGPTIGLSEVERGPAPSAKEFDAARKKIDADLRDEEMQEEVSGADAVIIGTVMSVKGPKKVSAEAAEADVSEESEEGESEHDALWTDAEVEVTEWLKGKASSNRVTVRFPASIDVVWFKVPKLKAGTQELLFLHNDTISTTTAPAAKSLPQFVLRLPTDEEPIGDAPIVRKAVQETAK
jgi:hypothetical protein